MVKLGERVGAAGSHGEVRRIIGPRYGTVIVKLSHNPRAQRTGERVRALMSDQRSWSANGMFVDDSSTAKRGPFTDPVARHQFYYSPFHSQADLCGPCHDVSNPAFSLQQDGTYAPNTFDMSADVDNGDFNPHKMFPIERTYSEWKMNALASNGGDMGGSFGGNKQVVSTCQDCHIEVEEALAASVHKKLACEACHVKILGGYEMTSWGPGLIESKPNPFKKYSLYYGPQEPPILIKDQSGRWMPTKIWPHSAGRNVRNCWPRRRPIWRCWPGAWRGRGILPRPRLGSGSGRARSSANTRWPNILH